MAEIERRDVALTWNDVRLAGTLHLPASPAPHPVVLMMQGSGPADRDGDGYFPPIRDAFLSRGIAVYSFDKPGIGDSSGDWRHYGLAGRTDQALAVIAVLREQKDIDPRRVGIWGQSQGGWLVQMIAARLPDLAIAIANSGPGIGVAEQDLYGCEHTMRAAGKSETDIAHALAFLDAMHAAALRGDDYPTAERLLIAAARDEPWYGYLTFDDAEDWGLICRFIQERYEPSEALARVRCPFLALFGGLDPLLPALESAAIYGKALRAAGNRDATIVVFPQANHRIFDPETGAFATGYLDLLADWAATRVAT
jgi:pimeloyl-ACP methyl ester carboxylesterase